MNKVLSKILLLILITVSSWACMCVLVKLITMCFDLDFTWKIGTGVWLSSILLRVTVLPNDKK